MSGQLTKQIRAIVADVTRFGDVKRDTDGHAATIRVLVPPGPEVLWPMIRKLGEKGPFAIDDVVALCRCPPGQVESYMARLHMAGYVAAAGETTDRKRLWQLTSQKVVPPFLDTKGNPAHGHEMLTRIWRALKMAKAVSVSTLRSFVDDGEVTLSADTARTYLNALAEAGYLDVIEAKVPLGERRYRLKPGMMTGPLPPRLLRATLVYDPNRKELSSSARAQEVRL